MGAQDEYLRSFLILRTEKGIVPITDPAEISVYECLLSGPKRPSDICDQMGIASSSLHFILDKLVDDGVVVKTKSATEKNTVFYSDLAVKIAGSSGKDGDNQETEGFDTIASRYKGLASVANMMESYLFDVGLDHDALKSEYAANLADMYSHEIGKKPLQDAIYDIKAALARLSGYSFSIFSLNPLTVVFEGDGSLEAKAPMLSAFITRAVENACGKRYVVKETDAFTSRTFMVKVVFQETAPVASLKLKRSVAKDSSNPFTVIELDGKAGLLTNSTQVDIIDAVYERPLCISDIVARIDAPRSTITANLLRMVEEGVMGVFYSESGPAYYGLSCSILMRKSNDMRIEKGCDDSMLASVKEREGALMEGYILYTLSQLKQFGFDTDYLMVVLGAKYMRAAGGNEPANFDAFFGKMSEVAQNIGLSLNVVSIYPLTIGIASNDPDSKMSPATTFMKGMAHQGLEMTGNGIFVRNSEETAVDQRVSFKEIYPALSMTPSDNVVAADPVETKKKHAYSMKAALSSRNAKANKPARTVRYITGIAVLMFVVALAAIGFGGPYTADSDICTVDCGIEGVELYDEYGAPVALPYKFDTGRSFTFSLVNPGEGTVGYISDGIAVPYLGGSMTVTEDTMLVELNEAEIPAIENAEILVYNFEKVLDNRDVVFCDMFVPIDEYIGDTGRFFFGEHPMLKIVADDGFYIAKTDSHRSDTVYFDTYRIWGSDVSEVCTKALPDAKDISKVMFNGEYEIDGQAVTGELKVRMYSTLRFNLITTDGNVDVFQIGEDGREPIKKRDDGYRLMVKDDSIGIDFRGKGLF